MSNFSEFLDFFSSKNILNEILDIAFTEDINIFLESYWNGSTSSLNWQEFTGRVEKFILPSEIDCNCFNYHYLRNNFSIFSVDKVVIYYSGLEKSFVVSTDKLINNLYDLMDFFCYLDGIFIFSYDEILKKDITNFCIEFKFFEYIYGLKIKE